MPRLQVVRKRELVQSQFLSDLFNRHGRIPVEPHGIPVTLAASGRRLVAASAARDVPFSSLCFGTLAQLAARLLQILVIEAHMLTKPGKGNPAPLGGLRQRKFSCAKQFDGGGILLPAPRTNAPLLVVSKPQPPTLQLPAFKKFRTVRTKLIAQTRRVQSEQVRDLRHVVFDILCIVAGCNRIAVLGARSRSLAPTSPQARYARHPKPKKPPRRGATAAGRGGTCTDSSGTPHTILRNGRRSHERSAT